MVSINDIKDNIVMCLRQKFPKAKFYKDGEIKSYPNFYVTIVNMFLKIVSVNKAETYKLDIFVRIEYREAEELLSVTGLNSILDDVGFKMLACLKSIQIRNKKYFTDITNNETIDNVRIFEFNFSLYLKFDEIQSIKMEKLIYKGVEGH